MENQVDDSAAAADYEAAVGANAHYYLPRFAEFDKGASRVGWHWPAFFATSPWFLYRKMWVPGILTLFYPFILCFVAGIGAALLAGPINTYPLVFAAVFLLLLAAPWFVLPMFANAIYWRHIRGLIGGLPRLEQAPDKRAVHLARHGGTSVGALIGVLAVIVVVFIGGTGILAAIAIPAYQDYTIRAQITEGLNLAGAPKAAVADYYAEKADWPEDSVAAGLAPISGLYVESVAVQNGSILIVYGNTSHPQIAGKTLILRPGVGESDSVIWSCANTNAAGVVEYAPGPYGSDVPNKYLPSLCRAEQ